MIVFSHENSFDRHDILIILCLYSSGLINVVIARGLLLETSRNKKIVITSRDSVGHFFA